LTDKFDCVKDIFTIFKKLKNIFMKTFIQIISVFTFLFILFESSNAQWQVSGSYTGNVLSFVVKDSVLIAGTYGNGAYYTTNGINWTYSTSGMTDLKIISMTLNGNIVFAGSEASGVYRSTDNGVNWTQVNTGLTSFEMHTMCSNAGSVFAGNNNGVYMTSDNGTNWTKISTSTVGSTIFAVTAYNGKVIATSANGVFITTNGGTNWNNISAGILSYIYCLTSFNNTVYAGSSSAGVFKTTNDGLNWIQLNTGLPFGKAVRTVFCETGKIYAAVYNSGGIYYLQSSDSTWIPANEGLTQPTSYTVISFNNYMYAGTTTGMFRRPKNEFSSINKTNEKVPGEFKLYKNYPNPFNSQTKIKFSVPSSGKITDRIKLDIFDLSGKLIEHLFNDKLSAGIYELNYNAENLASGSYIIRLSTGSVSVVDRIMLIK
jgi:hypothetical protein